MVKHGETLERKVAQLVDRLPPMPVNISRLLNLSADRSQNREAFRQLAEDDPGLCTELLHMANSSCFCGHGQAETIDEAIDCVDTEMMTSIVGIWFARDTIRNCFRTLEHLPQYFDHSREISLGCCILCEQTGMRPHDRDLYTLAGLIHDIGRLIIMLAADEHGATLLGTSWEKMLSIVQDEKKILGLNHCEIGQQVCARWHFSDFLQEGVLRHHTPLVGQDFSFPGAVIFLSHFVSLSDISGEILTNVLPQGALSTLDLSPCDVQQAREIYRQRRRKWIDHSIWK